MAGSLWTHVVKSATQCTGKSVIPENLNEFIATDKLVNFLVLPVINLLISQLPSEARMGMAKRLSPQSEGKGQRVSKIIFDTQ
jgi:hypothetical protein